MSQSGTLEESTSGGGTVNSVTGTADRITIGGTATDPTVDIASTYAGQSSIDTLGTVSTGTWEGDVIDEVYGGTGQNTYATGDLLYASGANTLAKLPAGSDGEILRVSSGVPSWDSEDTGGDVFGPASSTDGNIASFDGATGKLIQDSGVSVSDVLVDSDIGVNIQSYSTNLDEFSGLSPVAGDIIFANNTPEWSKLSAGSDGEVLKLVSGLPSWEPESSGGQVDSVTGTADRISIGGTSADPTVDIASTYAGQSSINTLGTIGTGTWEGTAVGAVYGGTGQTTWAEGDLLYGTGVNTLGKLSAGSDGEVLTLAGGVPTWATSGGGGGSGDIEYYFKPSDFDVLETNFAPLIQDNGSNARLIARSFDEPTETFVNFSVKAPSDIDTAGTVTFRVWGYAETAVASRFVQMRVGHHAVDNGESWDGTYTNEDSGDIAVNATQDNIVEASWTETVSNLGWASDDFVLGRLSRIDPSGTELSGAFQLIGFAIEIPRS